MRAGWRWGNVVGSNIANILLVLGAPALISAMAVGRDIARDYIIMIGASLLFIAVAFTGQIGTWQALVLLGAFSLFMFDSIRRGLKARVEPERIGRRGPWHRLGQDRPFPCAGLRGPAAWGEFPCRWRNIHRARPLACPMP